MTAQCNFRLGTSLKDQSSPRTLRKFGRVQNSPSSTQERNADE